jgi:hypothetical protein
MRLYLIVYLVALTPPTKYDGFHMLTLAYGVPYDISNL